MQAVRQLGSGLIYGLVSVVLVVGGLSLALAESYIVPRLTGTPGLPAVPQALTSTPSGPTQPATLTPTPLPPVNCPPPAGWILVTVQPGDTLASLAEKYGTTPAQLGGANCLLTQSLAPGYGIYVPPFPTTAIPCGPLPGWTYSYVVQGGDTLYHIAQVYSTTVADLKLANCKTGSVIFIGERLWVPDVATITPGLTIIPEFNTSTEVPTEPLTLTPLPFTATVIPTSTSAPYPSATASPTPTITAFPTVTP